MIFRNRPFCKSERDEAKGSRQGAKPERGLPLERLLGEFMIVDVIGVSQTEAGPRCEGPPSR